jgi:hypothetical protein
MLELVIVGLFQLTLQLVNGYGSRVQTHEPAEHLVSLCQTVHTKSKQTYLGTELVWQIQLNAESPFLVEPSRRQPVDAFKAMEL